MAPRTRKVALTDSWKENIRVENLMTRLYKIAIGEIEATKTQIDATKIILAKILPDLKAMELSGNEDKPLQTVIRWAEDQGL